MASIFAFFLPMSRVVGVFITLPYLVYLIYYVWNKTKRDIKNFLFSFFKTKQVYYILIPLIGFVVYLLFMKVTTGSFVEGFLMEKYNVGKWGVDKLFNPTFLFVNLFFPDSLSLHGFVNSIIDRLFFIAYCVSLYFIYKKLDKTLFVYALLMGMIPIFGSFMSLSSDFFLVHSLMFW